MYPKKECEDAERKQSFIKCLTFTAVTILGICILIYLIYLEFYYYGHFGGAAILGTVLLILILFPICYVVWRIILLAVNIFGLKVNTHLDGKTKEHLAIPCALNITLLAACLLGILLTILERLNGAEIEWNMLFGMIFLAICQTIFILDIAPNYRSLNPKT